MLLTELLKKFYIWIKKRKKVVESEVLTPWHLQANKYLGWISLPS